MDEAVLVRDELSIAEDIRDGKLESPQVFENVTLFQIRITGTGMSFRSAHKEFVWRDSGLYLNDRFLRRCSGLPVLWEHPEKGSLDSKEFGARAIGSIMLAFIQGTEVHGIAKIYDDAAARMMMDGQMSTSPGVVLRNVDNKIDFDDGSVLLIEDEPLVVDHVAICEQGVWDKGGPPTGVVNSTLRTDSMTEKVETVEARADTETGAKLDKMMSYFDSFASRLDAMEADAKARKDSDDKEKEDRKDKARKDAKSRRDAERADWAKDDAEMCSKDDAEEEEEKKKFCDSGDDEDMAMDKARSARKDRMKARKDADDEKAEKEKEKEKETKDDAARSDAQAKEFAALRAENENLKKVLVTMPKSPNDDDYGSMAELQFAADGAYQAFGRRAMVPMSGENPLGYRRRLAKGLQDHSPEWKGIDLTAISSDVLALAEKKIYADAMVASRSSVDVPDGIMIPVKRTTDSGHQVIEYRGKTTIFKAMSSNPLYATKFHTERGA